jgi:hypothetical protein
LASINPPEKSLPKSDVRKRAGLSALEASPATPDKEKQLRSLLTEIGGGCGVGNLKQEKPNA